MACVLTFYKLLCTWRSCHHSKVVGYLSFMAHQPLWVIQCQIRFTYMNYIWFVTIFYMNSLFLRKLTFNPILSDQPLKLEQFTYLVCNISSTERDVNIHLAKAWNAIGRLSIIWKSDLSDEIKQNFFQVI